MKGSKQMRSFQNFHQVFDGSVFINRSADKVRNMQIYACMAV